MTQYAVPTSDISKTDWSQRAGDGDGDAFDELDEGINSGTPDDDTTAWQTAPLSAGATRTIECGLGSLTDPGVHTGHTIRIRARASGTTGTSRAGVIYLYQGTTLISTSSSTVFNVGYATKSHTISEAEAANITDYSALRIRAIFTWSGSGAARSIIITAMEMEVPDASAGPITITLNTLSLSGSVPASDVQPGAVSLTLDTLSLASSAPSAVLTATTTIVVDTLLLAGSVPSSSILPGAVSLTLDTLLLAGSAPSLTVSASGGAPQTVTLTTLSLLSSVLTGDVTPGGIGITLNTLFLSSSIPMGDINPGAVSVALNTLLLNGSAITGSIINQVDVTVALQTLLLHGVVIALLGGKTSDDFPMYYIVLRRQHRR